MAHRLDLDKGVAPNSITECRTIFWAGYHAQPTNAGMNPERDSIQAAPFLPGAAVPPTAALADLGSTRVDILGVRVIHEAVQVRSNCIDLKRSR